MNKPLASVLSVAVVLMAGTVWAYQGVHNVRVVDTQRNDQICTIRINDSHHITTSTKSCRRQYFSWKCLPKDYRFVLAEQSEKHGHEINIRFSEYQCEPFTNNMHLLTAW